MPKKFFEQRCDMRLINQLQLTIEVSFAVSLSSRTQFREVIPAKLSNETSFNMDRISTYTRLLVSQKEPCWRSTTCRGIRVHDTLILVP